MYPARNFIPAGVPPVQIVLLNPSSVQVGKAEPVPSAENNTCSLEESLHPLLASQKSNGHNDPKWIVPPHDGTQWYC